MFKIYQKYLIKKFLVKFGYISLTFFALSVVLGVLEEISFFKNLESNFLFPLFLTLINAPSTLFEIFPFIVLLTTQFLFFELYKNKELNLLKTNGLNNIKIIKILTLTAFFIGILNISVFYNLSSGLKFYYSDIKNSFSNDNKYLAMVTNSGLWIKDETNNTKIISKSKKINDNILSEIVISEFDKKFNLIRIINSNKVDIKSNEWIIYNPQITTENNISFNEDVIYFKTNFNEEKINNSFSNISTLNLLKLYYLKKDFDKLGYSSDEVLIHIYKLFTTPFFYSILTILSSILMINISHIRSMLFHIILGILMSVIIYYINFILTSLSNSGRLPIVISTFFPLILFSLISLIGLVNINEK